MDRDTYLAWAWYEAANAIASQHYYEARDSVDARYGVAQPRDERPS